MGASWLGRREGETNENCPNWKSKYEIGKSGHLSGIGCDDRQQQDRGTYLGGMKTKIVVGRVRVPSGSGTLGSAGTFKYLLLVHISSIYLGNSSSSRVD